MKCYVHKDLSGPRYVTVPEYREAKMQLLRCSQKFAYHDEYRMLEQGKFLPVNSPLASLAPFLDANGIMRVGGRLQKADLRPSTTHPTILSVKSHIMRLLLEHNHVTLLHAGPSTVMATLAFHYHIPTIKRALKKLYRACVYCRLLCAKTSKQQMGELPEVRT